MSRGYLVETLYNFVKLLLLQCHMLETASLDVFFFLLYSLNVLFFKSSETQVFFEVYLWKDYKEILQQHFLNFTCSYSP